MKIYYLIIIFIFNFSFANAKDFKLIKIIDSLKSPWSLSFINQNEALITEKSGNIVYIDIQKKELRSNDRSGKLGFIISSYAKNCGYAALDKKHECNLFKPLISKNLIAYPNRFNSSLLIDLPVQMNNQIKNFSLFDLNGRALISINDKTLLKDKINI